MSLPSRPVPQTVHAAAAEGVALRSRQEQLGARLAEDESALELLRSVPEQSAEPAAAQPVPPLRWAAPPGQLQLVSQASTPRQAPTWTQVHEEVGDAIPGPLAGLAVGVKDLLDVRGYAVTAGTRAHRASVATADAPAVAALRAAGARIVGMTNLHALAYGATGTSSDWGAPLNPTVEGAVPGGSSSGSAVAVAEGSADLALGTDTAGSIRNPAAMCAVVGLKPTYDAVSRAGCHPLSPTMDHVGPIARDVRTVAAAFDALTGHPVSGLGELAEGRLVVGVLGGYFAVVSDQVRAAVDAAVEALERAGVELRPVEPVLAAHSPGAQLGIQSPEALRSNLATLRERADELPEDVRIRLEVGFARTPEQHAAGLDLARRLRGEVDAMLAGCHVLLAPTTAASTPPVGQTTVEADGTTMTVQSALTRLTVPFNLSGHPAISLPWTDPAGTLVGLQVVGRHGGDRELLHVAAHLEGLLRP